MQKAKHVGVESEGKTAVVKLAMTADVHCLAQSLIQGDVSTETCQPSDPQVPEGQDAAETPQTTGTTETAEAMVTSSETAGAQPKVQVQWCVFYYATSKTVLFSFV